MNSSNFSSKRTPNLDWTRKARRLSVCVLVLPNFVSSIVWLFTFKYPSFTSKDELIPLYILALCASFVSIPIGWKMLRNRTKTPLFIVCFLSILFGVLISAYGIVWTFGLAMSSI